MELPRPSITVFLNIMRAIPLAVAVLLGTAFSVCAADPVISEFMADNSGYLADQDGQFMDWIEIYNPGPGTANLQDWSLTDDSANLVKWKFPAHPLNAGQSVLIWHPENTGPRQARNCTPIFP